MLRTTTLILTAFLSTASFAAEQNFTISGGQVSVPVGLTVQVKSVTVGEDATNLRLRASFDSSQTLSVNMNDRENAYLSWADGDQGRLHMRQISSNKWMRISNGKTMEGDLVFPGTIPADVTKVVLFFNPGNASDDSNAPGVTIPLELKK